MQYGGGSPKEPPPHMRGGSAPRGPAPRRCPGSQKTGPARPTPAYRARGPGPPPPPLERNKTGRGGRQPSAARAPGEPNAQGVTQHGEAVAHGTDAALLHVPPLDGHLLDPQAKVLGEQQELDVECEAGNGELLEQTKGGLAREHLEAALRVAEAGQAEEPEREVERLARELPQPGLSHWNDAGGHGPRRAHHLSAPALDRREALRDLRDAGREIGVGEGDHAARRGEHACAHGSSLALVALQAKDRRLQRGGRKSGTGYRARVVVARVVDQDDVGARIVEGGGREGANGPPDARRLPIHRDDQRPGARCAIRVRHGEQRSAALLTLDRSGSRREAEAVPSAAGPRGRLRAFAPARLAPRVRGGPFRMSMVFAENAPGGDPVRRG